MDARRTLMLLLLLLLLLLAAAQAKVFERCEWARKLKSSGMDGYRGIRLADWVCLTEHESRFDTRAINTANADGSTDYGIFQINNRWWCDDGSTRTANGCNIRCNQLLQDDVTVAIECAKRVVRDPQGIEAWYAWQRHCKHSNNLGNYLRGCRV